MLTPDEERRIDAIRQSAIDDIWADKQFLLNIIDKLKSPTEREDKAYSLGRAETIESFKSNIKCHYDRGQWHCEVGPNAEVKFTT